MTAGGCHSEETRRRRATKNLYFFGFSVFVPFILWSCTKESTYVKLKRSRISGLVFLLSEKGTAMKRVFTVLVLLGLLAGGLLLNGCGNTWRGAGRDVERVGDQMQERR